MNEPGSAQQRSMSVAATGIEGLDEVLRGGFSRERVFLIEGSPGVGKTTLALRWLLEGVDRGEVGLHLTLSETLEELRETFSGHDWPLDQPLLRILELDVARESLEQDEHYTMYHPSEVELGETVERILGEIERSDPARVVIDSLSELRLLAAEPLRYRRQILALKQFLSQRSCTVLLLSAGGDGHAAAGIHSLVHGVLTLEIVRQEYGPHRRRLRVEKMRGRAYAEGNHDYTITRGGLVVYPRLVAAAHRQQEQVGGSLESDLPKLDAMLGGGLATGTTTLLLGPTGVGKSTVASQYVAALAKRGENAIIFSFDEARPMYLERLRLMGYADASRARGVGAVEVQQVDPAELSPGAFFHEIRRAVEDDDVKLVVIDSLNGLLSAMPEERFVLIHLHEILMYLRQREVSTFMIMTQPGLFGNEEQTPVNVSYLADTVMLLRYFEAHGAVHKVISVLKQRGSAHEQLIRELVISREGVHIGKPLDEFQGVLSGIPSLTTRRLDADTHDDA